MRLFVPVVFFCAVIAACNTMEKDHKAATFRAFDFSYNDFFSTSFSMKFTSGDTVFIRLHWVPFYDSVLKKGKYYFAVLQPADRLKLDSFIASMNFAGYDSVYFEDYQDGEYYQYFIDKDSLKKTVFVHSHSAPAALGDFTAWITGIKERLRLTPTDRTCEFGSLKDFLPFHDPPPPPLPPISPDSLARMFEPPTIRKK